MVSKKKDEQYEQAHLREKIKSLERDNKRCYALIGDQRETANLLRSAVIALDPLPLVPFKENKSLGKPVMPVIKFSDWHIGEVISAAQTEGFGEYNLAIATKRINNIVDSFLHWVIAARSGYNILECAIFCEGDFISGNIHHELIQTNEFGVVKQTAVAADLLASAIARIAPHFETVHVVQVGSDNHSRLTHKPQFKNKAEESMSYMLHHCVNLALANHSNVKTITAEGIMMLVDVNGSKFLVQHGDTIKSWQGVPYYGMDRSRARESTRRMNTDKTFDYISMGHFHVPAYISDSMLVNGSLSGTSEFDHGCGRFARPSQMAFMVHPKDGVFNLTWFRG